jgi:ribosomal protein S18 acetylase RimI-like enzyme
VTAVEIAEVGVERLDELAPLYAALHEFHRGVSAVPLTEPLARAWAARRATYAEHLDAGRALVHLATLGGRPVGYAFTILHEAGDDTFPLAPGYAELYTLSVAAAARGRGVGSALLDAVDAALADRGVTSLVVAVMAANVDAIRLYERRGLVPGEVLLYRLGRPSG